MDISFYAKNELSQSSRVHLSFSALFNGNRIFEIPSYHRAYVWEEPQWKCLLDDVEKACSASSPHSMGVIILQQRLIKETEPIGDVRILIDGHQRLVTLAVLFKVLCLKHHTPELYDRLFLPDDQLLALQYCDGANAQIINQIMTLKHLQTMLPTDPITRAYRFFAENIKPERLNAEEFSRNLVFEAVTLRIQSNAKLMFEAFHRFDDIV